MKNDDNAQVTIDYITGIGIFLISIAFVFQFMYTLFIPFHSGTDEAVVAADRASLVLVERVLRAEDSGTLNVVELSRLESFITTKLNFSNDTNYNNGLREAGLFSNHIIFDLNVSVTSLSGDTMYEGGPELPDNTNIGQASQVVLLVNTSTGYSEPAVISVRVW
ncbi:MAG: hypothetical protein IBX39_07800 [Candidatus Methanoperedenaceae archaeon]|nr:hypothetical protein [Candidatus Methanoperedenaceae archaeon]